MKIFSLIVVLLFSLPSLAKNWWSVNDLSTPSLVFFYSSGDRTNAGRSQNFRIGGFELIDQERVRVISGSLQASQVYHLDELRNILNEQLKQRWFFQITYKEAIYSIIEWIDLVESQKGQIEQKLITRWLHSWDVFDTLHIEMVLSFYTFKAPHRFIESLLETNQDRLIVNSNSCASLF